MSNRPVCVKLSAAAMSQPAQAQCCRSKASSRMVEIQNSVKSHIPIHSGSSTESNIEIEVATHLRDCSTVTEEKIVPEGKNKAEFNVNRAVNHSTVTGKISSTPKTCSIPVLDCSSDFCNLSGADSHKEQGVNKIKSTSLSAVNSKISLMSASITASKMSHLIVQRPPTILRTSRADFVPPAFNKDKVQTLSQSLSSSGVGAGPSRGVGEPLMVTSATKKVDNTPAKIPLQSVWCGSDEYRRLPEASISKSGGPPSKKQMIWKSSSHSGKVVNSGFGAFAENFPVELDNDREELLIAADSARNARSRACSSSLWKMMECYFTSVTLQHESYLKNQLDFADVLGGSLYKIPGNENDVLDDPKLQQHPTYSGGKRKHSANQELIGTRTLSEVPSLCQRVLSALIEDIESKEMSLHCEGRNGFQCARDDSHCGSCNHIGFDAENRERMAFKNINCEAKGRRMDREVDPQLRKKGHVPRISRSDLDFSLESIASPIASPNCNHHMLSVEDKLRAELQSIDVCPKRHQIVEEYDPIDKDILQLQAQLAQQVRKKEKFIKKIHESIKHEKDAEERNMEQAAMSKLIEMAYKKQRVSWIHSSKRVLRRVSKQAALPFAERTLARCREFEDTGKSCFSEAALQNIIFTPPNSVDKHTSRSSNSKNKSSPKDNLQPKGSRSKDKQKYLLPNNACSASVGELSGGSVKGKRSERARDQTDKTNLKLKVKSSYLLASEADPGSRYMEPTHAVSDSPLASSLSMAIGNDVARKKEEPHNVEKNRVNIPTKQTKSIAFERGDSTSLLGLDVDGGQDQDWIGLDVPMDDLSDIHLFI